MGKRRTSAAATATAAKRTPRQKRGAQSVSRKPARIEESRSPKGAAGEHAWVEVIRKMDEVYRQLLDYEVALEQNNAALQESQLFIVSVLSSMSDVLIVCNPAGIVEELNPSLLKLTGKSESELRGSSILGLFADGPSREAIERLLAADAAETLSDWELQMHTSGGQSAPVALSCTPRFTS